MFTLSDSVNSSHRKLQQSPKAIDSTNAIGKRCRNTRQERRKISKKWELSPKGFCEKYQMLYPPLLRLVRGAWSAVIQLRKAKIEYASPPLPVP